jgi:hypothetical protein
MDGDRSEGVGEARTWTAIDDDSIHLVARGWP